MPKTFSAILCIEIKIIILNLFKIFVSVGKINTYLIDYEPKVTNQTSYTCIHRANRGNVICMR